MAAALARQEWLELRRQAICATDISAILGLNPYRTPRDVYEEKLGLAPDERENEAMLWGSLIEPLIAKEAAKVLNVEPVKAEFCRHAQHPYFGATPDYLIGQDAVLECKCAGVWAGQHFGAAGTDEVPDQYLCQVTWQCFVTGRPKWQLWVLLGGNTLRDYCGIADPELMRRMEFHARKFWNEYIVAQHPPPLTGHAPDTDRVKAAAPLDTGAVVRATYEIEEEAHCLEALTAQLAELETRAEGCRNRIKEFMAEASILESSLGKFTWKATAGRTVTDWKGVAAACNASEDLIAQHTETKPGYRRFTTPFRSDKA